MSVGSQLPLKCGFDTLCPHEGNKSVRRSTLSTQLMDWVQERIKAHSRDEIIRDQLFERTNYRKVQEKLLATDDPDLETVLRIARSIEHSQYCMKEMNEGAKAVEVKHLKVKSKSSQTLRGGKMKPHRELEVSSSRVTEEKGPMLCFHCGSKLHMGNSKYCAAVNQNCFKCGKRRHFARVCKASIGIKGGTHQAVRMLESSYCDSEEENSEVLFLSSIRPEWDGAMEILSMVVA
ncbi:hypothetical protein NDU88_000856 [Pleurodeles waltl]|uniref:CCHC-type domain-containing protein n=1 Tax=Pleurodeles waltl TaxID=8319 RepID=A0AAV7Q5E0_PLEWA|nr:hypothetical protein NDU88_000856 [Pleurodeles waltl]